MATPMNTYTGRNRTIFNSGVVISGLVAGGTPIVGTGVTPAQAGALAAPLAQFLSQIPYDIDANGRLSHQTGVQTLTHLAELVYAPGHPNAGLPIFADFFGGDYITKYGGAPMPFIDMEQIHPKAMESLLIVLNQILVDIMTAV